MSHEDDGNEALRTAMDAVSIARAGGVTGEQRLVNSTLAASLALIDIANTPREIKGELAVIRASVKRVERR